MGDLPSSHHRSGWVQYFFPIKELRASLLHSWFFGHPHDSSSLRGTGRCCLHALGNCFLDQSSRCLLQKGHTFEYLFISEGEVTPQLFPQFLHTLHQQVWLPSSRQINLLCPMLEGSGVCHCFLLLYLLNIPTGIDGAGWWHELFPEKTWQCGRGLVVVLHFVQFTHPSGKLK